MRKRCHSKGTADRRKQTVLCTCTSHNYVECCNYTSTYTHALNMHTLYTHVPTQHVSLSTLMHSLQTQPLSDIIACTDISVHAYVHEERLGNIFENHEKPAATRDWGRGPLTLAVSALPPELWPPGDSQPSPFSISLHMCHQNPTSIALCPVSMDMFSTV